MYLGTYRPNRFFKRTGKYMLAVLQDLNLDKTYHNKNKLCVAITNRSAFVVIYRSQDTLSLACAILGI